MPSAPTRFLLAPLLGLAAGTAALIAPAAAAPQTWKFSAGTSPRVRIDNIAGKIQVQPSSDGQVHVEATKRGGDPGDRDRMTIQVTNQAQAVEARVCCGPCSDQGGDHNCPGRVEVDFVVRAPAASRLVLKGVSTDVTASGIAGDHEINTVSGDVQVSGARDLRLNTVSGNARIDGAAAVKLNTVSGDLQASNVRGATDFHSVSGDIEWRGGCAAGCRIEAQTTSGDFQLALGAQSSFELEFESRSGDFEDDLGTTVSSRDQNPTRVRAKAGRGEGRIEFRSVSGDLELTR
jgi:hypothetical protein